MLYTLDTPLHTALLPVIVPGVPGNVPDVTASEADALPQALLAITLTLPPVPVGVTLIEAVPAPEFTVQPAGTVQV